MFGHQNNDQSYNSGNPQDGPMMIPDDVVAPPVPQAPFGPQAPGVSHTFNPALPSPSTNSSDNNQDTPAAAEAPAPPATDAPIAHHSTPLVSDDLMDIKQKALSELSPLVNHLEQTPEEKFRTTMMMIQASDNQDLVKDAYAAAQQITDEKAKAQALLDIVNEINYFTQHHQN